MMFRNSFTNTSKRIVCDTDELKKLITNWAESGGWKLENFADFLELIGVKTPVKLGSWDETSRSFKCVTALGTEVRIALLFGDFFDFFPEIHITKRGETSRYIANSNRQKGSVPQVILQNS